MLPGSDSTDAVSIDHMVVVVHTSPNHTVPAVNGLVPVSYCDAKLSPKLMVSEPFTTFPVTKVG
jgi:hypothetical protein